MNFFEQQDRARGTTRKLVILFALAIASLIAVTTVLVVVLVGISSTPQGDSPDISRFFSQGTPEILLGVSVMVLGVVAIGAMFRQLQLRSGGKAVAESLGGRLLNTGTRDADERKVLNIVEEMAIASGVPVPQVYLLEDPAINAFAAGHDANDAVIGVTRGCIKLLNRDELQGVIAHEFSHIFNGDMRLNIRLIGWLYGITVLGLIGYYMMRTQSLRGATGRGRDDKGGLILLGLGLVVVGYGGTFFGNLIKAAVSRQREFLADASAVQYTRNPAGISGALKKIGGYSHGSQIQAPNAAEVSHLFFGQSVSNGLFGLFATHPPLEERIRRIEPGWQGGFIEPHAGSVRDDPSAAMTSNFAPVQSAGLVEQVGDPDEAHLVSAGRQLSLMPASLREAAHSTFGATLLSFGLLLTCSELTTQRHQLGWLHQRFNGNAYRQLQSLLREIQGLPRPLHLPLLELAIPALRALSESQRKAFLDDLRQFIVLDQHVSLYEWCMLQLIKAALEPRPRGALMAHSLNGAKEAVGVVLSALASAGSDKSADAELAFRAALEVLALEAPPVWEWHTYPDLQKLEQAFTKLHDALPLEKRRLLAAMVKTVEHDGRITPEEHELVRVAAAVLDCPMPALKMPESQS